MTVAATGSSHLDRFRATVIRHLGLHFDEPHLGLLSEVLERRGRASGLGVDHYLNRLEGGGLSQDEVRALAAELTVGETYFFRHMDQFRSFAEGVLPEELAAKSSIRCLRILSAGCSSGEEAYSLAILVRERLVDPNWNVSITGIDVNPVALRKAQAGRYSAWSLRETPPEVRRRWFHLIGNEYAVDPSIRAAVRFEERNLAAQDPGPSLEAYDVVFCRNLLMYLAPPRAQAVVERLSRALTPSGHLFLGSAETLRGLSQDFHLRHSHDAFYYQRRDPRVRSGHGTNSVPERGATAAAPAAAWDGCSTWIETVQQATERIRVLSEERDSSTGIVAAAAQPMTCGTDLSGALDLLKRERFADALDLLAHLPCEATRDADVLLLRAVLFTHSGKLDAAERTCIELCELDELNAGAHYLLALCREGVGDRAAALEHDQAAAHLDPDFAMPRLHLGLLARRTGDERAAQRELGLALTLLSREEPSRILLFGGGFTREALTSLCRAELRAVGGEP